MSEELRDYWSHPDEEDPKTTKTVTYVAKSSADDRIQERIQAYLNDLDKSSITVSDRSQIKNLARLEVAIEELTEKLSSIGTADSKSAKALSDNLTSLMAQHRQISSLLGIDRRSRANKGEGEYEEYLPKLHREAYNFLANNSIVILCPQCLQSKAKTKIVGGTIIFHFRDNVEFSWTSGCPKCGQKFTIDNTNWKDFTRESIENIGKSNGEDWATEEESN